MVLQPYQRLQVVYGPFDRSFETDGDDFGAHLPWAFNVRTKKNLRFPLVYQPESDGPENICFVRKLVGWVCLIILFKPTKMVCRAQCRHKGTPLAVQEVHAPVKGSRSEILQAMDKLVGATAAPWR